MHSHTKNSATVELDGKNTIVCRLEGVVTGAVVAQTMRQTEALAAQIATSGYRPSLLIDISGITKQTSEARMKAKALSGMKFERIAVSGGNKAIVMVGRYIARAGGMDKYTKFFREERTARRWLSGGDEAVETDTTLVKRAVASQLIIVLAGAALLGWILDVPLLRTLVPGLAPMNPMVAVGLLLLAAALIVMGKQWSDVIWRRLVVSIVAWWSIFFGTVVAADRILNASLGLDLALFMQKMDSTGSFTARAPLSAGLLFVVAGCMLLLLVGGQKRRWTREVFFILSTLILLVTISVLLGYSFAFYELYSFRGIIPMALCTALGFICFNFAIAALSRPTPIYQKAMKIFNAYWQAIVVGLLLVFATGISWQQTKANIASSIAVASREVFVKVENDLSAKMGAYSNALNGYRGLFGASQDVSPTEFNSYFVNSNLSRDYPGFLAITYVTAVPQSQKQMFVSSMRQRASAEFPKYSSFAIYPDNNNPVHYPITYTEPHTPTTRYGFDLGSESVRLRTLDEARDRGTFIGSEIINLNASRNDGTNRPGFFIAMPVYRGVKTVPETVQERRNHIQGFVLAYFENKQLFSGVFAAVREPNARFLLREVGTNEVVFKSEAQEVSADAVVGQNSFVEAGGKTWQLQMQLSPSFGVTEIYRELPGAVLTGGFIVAVLAAMLVLGQLRRRDQAIETAAQMTEDLNAERNLAVASRNKDEAILASIGDAVFAIDTNKRITLFNPACERISGFTANEAIGRNYKDILHFTLEKTGKVNDGFVQQALQGHVTSMKNHTKLRRKDGKSVAVADSAAPIYDLRGALLGVIVVFRDVSKEYELDQAKTEFVSLASHQLRTPLSAINWYGELLLNGDAGKLKKDQQEYVREIYEGSQRMIELVSSLLDVSRLDLGKLSNQPVATNMGELVKNLEHEMTTSIQAKGLTVVKDIDSTLPPVWAEPKLLRMIVQNLLSNAVKYTGEKGTVTVVMRGATAADIQAAKVKGSGGYLFMSVADTGYGIPRAQQSKIFGKLFRADNVRALDVEGTGLGLYIVRQVIEKLGGRVWFESEENKGAVFYVLLPFKTKTMMSDTKQMGNS